jgi:hypothetical protein
MIDAALLAMPDHMGGTLWRPSSLQDIYDLPERTLRLYIAYRAGQSHAMSKAQGGGKSGTIGGVQV